MAHLRRSTLAPTPNVIRCAERAPHCDHARPARRHVDRHCRQIGMQPVHLADGGLAGELEGVDRWRRIGREERVERRKVERLTAEVGDDDLQIRLEVRDARRRAAQVGERRVSPPDAEHRSATRLRVHARDRRGGRRGMTGQRVGHARGELQRRRGQRGGGERDVRVACEVLTVDEQQTVVPRGLDPRRVLRRIPRQ